jgi:tetratricopeptide (TPR) repeat protein
LLIADRYGNLEQVEKSLALLQQSQQSAKEAGEPVLGAEAQCTEAVMRASAGDAEAAQALFKAALGTLRASGPSATKPLAECLVFVSEAESGYWGMPAEAVTHGEEALTLFQGLPDVKGEPMVNVRSALAGAYGTLGRSHDAVVAYAQTLDALAALGREKSVDAMSSLQSMAVFQSRGGQTVSAIQSYERALEIAGGLQDSAPSMPSLEANYAKALTDAGRVAEALPIFERTLGNQAVRQNPANLASIELQAATAFCVAGNLNRCEALAQSAFAGLTKTRPPRHPLLGTSCLQRAQLALARGKTEDARQLLEESVAVYMEAKERSPLAIRALVLLARVDQELGKGDEATQRLEQAQAWAEQTSAGYEHSGWLGITALARAQIEQDRADPAEARKALDVALPHLLVSLGEQAPEARLARELVAKSR